MDLHNLKVRLQQHLGDGLVTIIGSGLSCAEGLPGMGEIAEHLRETIEPELVGDDVAAWNEIQLLIDTYGLESALVSVPPSPTLESAISAATGTFIAKREGVVIEEVFAGSRTLRLTRLLRHLLKPSAGLPIVTTNYDRLVEIAVEEAGMGADTMFVGRFAGVLDERESKLSFCRNVALRKGSVSYEFRPCARIYKPHGSIDWYLRAGRPVWYAGNLSKVPRLIITPGQNKFRNGYESPFDHHRSRANEAIDRSSRFLILGYGFNDDHLQTHLSPEIAGGKPTLMMTHKLSVNAETLATQCSNVIALDSLQQDGVEGTRVIIDKVPVFVSGLSIWDVNSFVDEVL